MTINTSALSGGGLLKIVSFDTGEIAAGASGDIKTETAGSGQFLKLTYLLTSGTGGEEAGMTLTIDGNDLFTNQPLTDETPTGYGISRYFTSSNTSGTISSTEKLFVDVYCKTFTLTKVVGSTGLDITFSYETLESL
jgi:hypothetical protein